MSSALKPLVEHYRNLCINCIAKKDENAEKYLSILLVLHKPTYIALKEFQNKKSK